MNKKDEQVPVILSTECEETSSNQMLKSIDVAPTTITEPNKNFDTPRASLAALKLINEALMA